VGRAGRGGRFPLSLQVIAGQRGAHSWTPFLHMWLTRGPSPATIRAHRGISSPDANKGGKREQ
jgi:hypothetical protein